MSMHPLENTHLLLDILSLANDQTTMVQIGFEYLEYACISIQELQKQTVDMLSCVWSSIN